MEPKYKHNFEYHTPGSVGEALELLDRYGDNGRVIAGGTDLIPKLKAGIAVFDHLISLKKIDELKEIRFDTDSGLSIGARVPLTETESNPELRLLYPALVQGIHSMANTQVRNRGTVMGNICNAVPSADTAPALLVYGARVRLRSLQGERTVPIEEFFTGVCRTVVQPNELATEILLPVPAQGAFSIYYKYAIRKALDLAMIGVAANVLLDGDQVVRDAKLALGAVAVTPKRAYTAEGMIIGKKLTEELIEAAAKAASEEDCKPISDIRATAEYRREMVRIHVRNALRKAVETR